MVRNLDQPTFTDLTVSFDAIYNLVEDRVFNHRSNEDRYFPPSSVHDVDRKPTAVVRSDLARQKQAS
jgi:hypothetical protein